MGDIGYICCGLRFLLYISLETESGAFTTQTSELSGRLLLWLFSPKQDQPKAKPGQTTKRQPHHKWKIGKIKFLVLFFGCSLLGISVPRPGNEPGPQQWNCQVLTTRTPGNSLPCLFGGRTQDVVSNFSWHSRWISLCIFNAPVRYLNCIWLCHCTETND